MDSRNEMRSATDETRLAINQPYKIGNVTIPNRLTLAPMAGYTDYAFRTLAARAGAGLCCSEMVSAKGLVYKPEKSAALLLTSPDEKVKCVQLFGHEPQFFEAAIRSPLLDKFDIIDINMGCPVPKVVRCGEGSALIKTPELAAEIVATCVKAAGDRPITVKTRIGYDSGEDVSLGFCKAMVDAGAAGITLHGRTRAAGYSGEADWTSIARLKESLLVPVIGSGDASETDILDRLDKADAVMIGRNALGDPWIFARLTGKCSPQNVRDTVIEHIDLMFDAYGERYTYTNMRHHFGYYLRGCRGQREIKQRLYSICNVQELRAAAYECFSQIID